MIFRNISEAKTELSALVDAVCKGEEVLIGEAGVPVARLVRYSGATTRRVPGAMKGRIVIHEDFDELPPDLAAVFGLESSQDACSTHEHPARRE
ncbi:MAG TPA: type II toxin-antitoxin system prevent-host-death family antitoxin [Kofleriaceae bacterium]|nr:type II toxin-antitoxin system prevent-host-death family antitoxin [Kofleriaceae bacterium]